MIFATNGILLVLSILHIVFLTSHWPEALVHLDSLPHLLTNQSLYDLFFGLAVGTMVSTCATYIFGKKWFSLLTTVAAAAALIAVYFNLPIAITYAPTTPSTAMATGALLGIATTILLARHKANDLYQDNPGAWAFCVLFSLVAFNFLMLVAPNSTIVPTGFEAPTAWSPTSLSLKHDDSVAIRSNLIFVTVRAALRPLVGSSILINNFVSMVLCAVGIGFLASAARFVGGTAFAFVALALMITDRWVLTAGLSGNLPVTLITTCGLLFFTAMKIAVQWRDRALVWSKSIFILVLTTSLFAMYSYAAVRIPFILSTASLGFLALFMGRSSLSRSLVGVATHIVAPIILAVGIVATVAYSGDITQFRRDLLVSWPQEAWRTHPGAGGLKDFVLIHNPDTPIWIQIARPSDGQNFSVFWNRTPSEVVTAFAEHASNIRNGLPDLFCLQPCLFFLLLAAIIRLISLPPRFWYQGIFIFVWAGLWLTAYLLVADASAYRRGVSFSAMTSLCGGFYFLSPRRNRGTNGVICAVAIALCALRFPVELTFANNPIAKATMFTVCGNGSSIRLLLTSPAWIDQDQTSYIVPLSSHEAPRENSCLTYAVNSPEWKRVMPHSRTIPLPAGSLITYVQGLTSSEAVLLHCSLQSAQDPTIDTLCRQGHPSISVRATIPTDDGGLPNAWVVLTPKRDQ